ncbi:hypothetical protein ABIB86_000412 [Bradyrhizobium sp. JR1.7]|uniref:hypothetical protein n=1 Tax=unclassified Bradyrhizobium TaxID=2631580 RepID=UPI003396D921
MDNFLWWSGVAFWLILSSLGILFTATYLIEQAIRYFGFYRTIMQFAWDRARAASKERFPG